MSKHDKLILKLRSNPKDFTFNELKSLVMGLGYELMQSGKTSGSRVAFTHHKTKHIIRLHKPHPGNEMKQYQIKQVYLILKEQGLI